MVFLVYLCIRCFFVIIATCLSGAFMAQGDIMDPNKPKAYTVADCFKRSMISNKFKADTIKSNYILKGEKIWRTISLENRQNRQIFSNGSKCSEIGLFEVMKYGIFSRKLNAFSSDDFNDTKNNHLSNEQILRKLAVHDTSVVEVFDSDGNQTTETIINNRYLYDNDISCYLLKEDWVINTYSGKMEKHIIAVAPLVFDKKTEKTVPLFWLYYAEWKWLFASFEARNFYSAESVTFHDLFIKHYYMSVVSKQSNISDRSVKAINHGKDIYTQGEVIEEKQNMDLDDLFQK
jgi:hypothetical protein